MSRPEPWGSVGRHHAARAAPSGNVEARHTETVVCDAARAIGAVDEGVGPEGVGESGRRPARPSDDARTQLRSAG